MMRYVNGWPKQSAHIKVNIHFSFSIFLFLANFLNRTFEVPINWGWSRGGCV
jgi:hypothetical protein